MDVLAAIKQKLLSVRQPVELVKEGYAKSSVYSVAKKLRNTHLAMPEVPPYDEVAELRRRREIVKLHKEIAELEAAKERLPDRVTALESRLEEPRARILFAEKQLNCTLDAVEDVFSQLQGFVMFMEIDEYGAYVERKRTEGDRALAEKKASEHVNKFRLERFTNLESTA